MLAALNRAWPRCTLRSIVEFGWGVAVAYLIGTAWLVEPLLVMGSSMAPTLRGTHTNFICLACATPFTVGLDEPASDFRVAVCPCCGDRSHRLDQAPVAAGDQILINRSAWFVRQPERGEVVALRQPRRANMLAVKRIVGLPGESIEIRRGDVFINGRRWRKTLAEQLAASLWVADSTHLPPNDIPPAVHWPVAPLAASEQMTLHVEGQRLMDRQQFNSGPLNDTFVYNQNRPIVGSAAVVDLRLVMRVTLSNAQTLQLIARRDDARPFRFELTRERVSLYDSADTLLATAVHPVPWHREFELTVSVVDAQYLLAVDGQTVLAWADEDEPAEPTTQRPFILLGSMLGATSPWALSHWELYRDAYYSDWPGAWPGWGSGTPCRLGPDEYFVLGDNSRVSIDSRDRSFGPVVENLLLGRAVAVVWPSQARHALGRTFQVLSPQRIRYIR